MRASDYICAQLVSRAIFVVWPANDHISNIRESELSASMRHLAVQWNEPLPTKDRRRDKWKMEAWWL